MLSANKPDMVTPGSISDDNPSYQQSMLEQLLINSNVPQYDFSVIKSLPHAPHAFTEGLLVDDGYLYESTGLYSESKLRKIDLANGNILQEYTLQSRYFGEGIAVIGSALYQLTYKENTGFVYNKNTFKPEKSFQYSTQGWGLTTDGKRLIMSDGTDKLQFIDPDTFQVTGYLSVTSPAHQPIYALNELEYIDGKIYANVWPTEIILIISPQSGTVEGWINIQALKPHPACMTSDCIANGIAYDENNHALYVTGKNWPNIYLIRIKPHNDPSG